MKPHAAVSHTHTWPMGGGSWVGGTSEPVPDVAVLPPVLGVVPVQHFVEQAGKKTGENSRNGRNPRWGR